jgi:hypothetical protein
MVDKISVIVTGIVVLLFMFNDKNNTETLCELIQRISLHFLGHTGQIYLIKRELGKGGYFVTGVKKKHRDASRIKWLNWWNANKDKYQ